MSTSLRDALQKAGLQESKKSQKEREDRNKSFKRRPKNSHSGHPQRSSSDNRQEFQRSSSDNRKEFQRSSSDNHQELQRKEAAGKRDHQFSHHNKQKPYSQNYTPAPRARRQDDEDHIKELKHLNDHQRHMTHCGCCKKSTSDVEFYVHERKGLSAHWLCLICADKFQISDDGRMTCQSETSRKRMFRREYGRTKRGGFVKDLAELADILEKGQDPREFLKKNTSHQGRGPRHGQDGGMRRRRRFYQDDFSDTTVNNFRKPHPHAKRPYRNYSQNNTELSQDKSNEVKKQEEGGASVAEEKNHETNE